MFPVVVNCLEKAQEHGGAAAAAGQEFEVKVHGKYAMRGVPISSSVVQLGFKNQKRKKSKTTAVTSWFLLQIRSDKEPSCPSRTMEPGR